MGHGLALAFILLALGGAGLAFVKPWGLPRGDLIRAQYDQAASERAALDKSLLQVKADLARMTAAKAEAERLAGMEREQAARKLADLETHAKAVMARAVDTERAVAAAQAAGAATAAKALADAEELRRELARTIAARDELAKRLETGQTPAGQPDAAAEAEFAKRLAAARTEAAERFMQARNEADRQITAAQADAAQCRADLEKAQAKATGAVPTESAPATAPACPPAAAAEPPAPSTATPAVVPAAEIAQQLTASGRISLYVPFDTGSAVVKPSALPSIEPIAAALRQDPKLKLLLVGHTDSQGDFGFNRQLSENRAKAIVDQLIAKHGIDRARLAFAGVADLAPIASNDTDAGRQRNRRVELVRR